MYQFEMAEKGYNCWARKVKDLLFLYGFGFVWNMQTVGNESIFLSEFKQRTFDIGIQQWRMNLETFSKLDTYRLFKSDLLVEKYLSDVTIDVFRRALCKFRVSNHSLHIESGRIQKLPRANRLCVLCELNQVETEFHFCLVCPLYCNLREKFIPESYYKIPTLLKFTRLLTSENPHTLVNLSKYLFYSFRLRETSLQKLCTE